jgi:hypothetical protein
MSKFFRYALFVIALAAPTVALAAAPCECCPECPPHCPCCTA